MKKQGWTYLRENISTDNPLAYFINRKGNRVFYVVIYTVHLNKNTLKENKDK